MARVGASDIIAGLVQRGVPQHVAEGVVMNFQDESGLDTGIQEANPTRGEGGYGLAQWTGPRRNALEAFARSQGKPVDDLNAQLDYFMMENAGPEAAAWKKVMYAPDARTAAVEFVNRWERPAQQYADQRSAKYSGMGDSPSEGGARFGGSGLSGPHVQHPPNPQTGTDGYVAPGASTAQPGATTPVASNKPDVDKYAEAASKALSGFGGSGGGGGAALGQGGNAPQMPSVAPQAIPAMGIVSGGANDAGYRDAMAMLMHRLNSGQIWA